MTDPEYKKFMKAVKEVQEYVDLDNFGFGGPSSFVKPPKDSLALVMKIIKEAIEGV